MELTEAGQADVPAVLAIVFGYLRLLREQGGVQQAIFEESRALAQLRWVGGDGAGWLIALWLHCCQGSV